MPKELERILVCGDRNWANQKLIDDYLTHIAGLMIIECIIEGEARGADRMARVAAEEVLSIPVLRFPANWKKYGRAAGSIRNQQMLDEGKPTWVIAFHNDIKSSKGTADMLRRAQKAGIATAVITEKWEKPLDKKPA